MVLTERGISLGLGSVNSATFLVWKIISQSELFYVLDGVRKHFRAIEALTDLFWKLLFSMLLRNVTFLLGWVRLIFELFLYGRLFRKVNCFAFLTVFRNILERLKH